MKSKVLQRKMFRDPSEDENVGIMQGFMDSLEEMLGGEEDMSEEDDSPSGAPDRTPSSPEILMNTLRGDMRSVDARVDELADMVGYNAASSTPLEVLALLQPVLKQQGIAALPASSAMPPPAAEAPSPAMAPPVSPVPAQGGGIATLPQGDMGQGPPPVAMAEGGEVNPYSGYANPMMTTGNYTGPMNFQSQQLAGGGIAPYTGPSGYLEDNMRDMGFTGTASGGMLPSNAPNAYSGVTGITGTASGGMDRMPEDYGWTPRTFPSDASSGVTGITRPASPFLDRMPEDYGWTPPTFPSDASSGVTGITGPASPFLDRMPADYGWTPPPPMGGDMINRMPADYGWTPPTDYGRPPPTDYGMPAPEVPFDPLNQPMRDIGYGNGVPYGGMTSPYSGPTKSNPLGGMTSPMTSPMQGGMAPSTVPFQGGGMPSPMTSPMTSPMQEMTPGGRPKNPKPSQFPMGGGPQQPPMRGPQQPPMRGPQQPPMRGPQQPPMRGPQQSPMGGGIGALPQGNMGASPKLMAKGGIVQHFQNGSVGEGGVTQVDESSGITYSPEMMDAFRQRILSMAGRDAMPIPDLMQRAQELAPQYRTLLGVDPSATKSQMLFDVAQAALNYAGNVNAQGQPMRGSQAARLAGAASGLPAAIGARAADAQKQNQAIRMAAMQGAQSEIDAARATNTSREDTLDKLAIEAMKQKGSARPMTPAEKTAYGISGPDASLPWVIDQTGKVTIAGGRPSVPLVNMGESKLGDRANFLAADQLNASYTAANGAMSTLNNINQIRPILNDKQSVFSGPISGAQVFVSRLANSFGVGGKTSQETLNNTVATMQNLALFELDAAAAMRGQGAITENERALIKRASAGDLATMTQDEVIELVNGLEKQANYRISQHNARLNNFATVYADDPNTLQSLNLFRLTDVPVMSAFPTSTQTPTTQPPSSNVTITPDAVAAEMARRQAAGQ